MTEPLITVETYEALDAFGDPVLLAVPVGTPRTDKTGSSVAVPVKSGNPFRDPGSGTFGNGPAGAKVSQGGDVLKSLNQAGQLYVTQIRNKTGATDIKVEVTNGRAHITMLKNGVVVSRLDLPIPKAQEQIGDNSPKPSSRDSVIDRARAPVTIDKLDDAARAARIDDLTDYLYARYNASGAIFSKPGSVRIDAPAGWDQKTIGGLTDIELQDVARRMSARGWSPEALKKVLLPNIKAERRNKILQAPKTAEANA